MHARQFPPSRPDSLLFFGLIRGYKQVPRLISAFRDSGLVARGVALNIVGAPWDLMQRQEVERALEVDATGITTTLEAVADETLHRHILDSGLVVLPYQRLYNSGVVLLALSLDRPVLVPTCAAALELQAEFGDSWVITYAGELDGAALASAFVSYQGSREGRVPLALTGRGWDELGERYADAYRAAIACRNARAPIGVGAERP